MMSSLQVCCYSLNVLGIKSIHILQNFSLLKNNYYRYNCFVNEISHNKINNFKDIFYF